MFQARHDYYTVKMGSKVLESSLTLCGWGIAGVQPRWIQGDSKVGTESASLEKYIFNHRYREIRNGKCSGKISGEKEAE